MLIIKIVVNPHTIYTKYDSTFTKMPKIPILIQFYIK